jgi:hypothetical protein
MVSFHLTSRQTARNGSRQRQHSACEFIIKKAAVFTHEGMIRQAAGMVRMNQVLACETSVAAPVDRAKSVRGLAVEVQRAAFTGPVAVGVLLGGLERLPQGAFVESDGRARRNRLLHFPPTPEQLHVNKGLFRPFLTYASVDAYR